LDCWFPEIVVRPSTTLPALTLPLFSDRDSRKGLLCHCVLGEFGLVDVVSLPIPKDLEKQFSDVNVFDLEKARAHAVGEDVFLFGFPNVFPQWPGPFALLRGGRITDEFVFTTNSPLGLDPGFSGSAILAGNFDLVGMIVGGEGARGIFVPGDIIASVVNNRAPSREVPLYVRDHSLLVRR
jgi:hypothetical protein